MPVDISQSGFHALRSAVTALRAEYAGIRAAVNVEATAAGYGAPELLGENIAATAWPNPPGGGFAWVGFSLPTQRDLPALAIQHGRTIYQLRAVCGVRHTDLGPGADLDLTGQDAGWSTGALMASVVATALVRHLTDYAGIYSAVLTGLRALPGDTTGGRDTFVHEVILDVHMMTYNAALTA